MVEIQISGKYNQDSQENALLPQKINILIILDHIIEGACSDCSLFRTFFDKLILTLRYCSASNNCSKYIFDVLKGTNIILPKYQKCNATAFTAMMQLWARI